MAEESIQHTPTNSDVDEKQSFVTPDCTLKDGSTSFQSGAIKDPSENDVLCGRGGSINSHAGNERFRQLVEKRKRVYLTARFKREKRLIASSIVSEIRALNPVGRFLTRDKSGSWRDIGDEKARDKTSQALRENAPSIRAEIETEINEQRAEMQRAEEEEVAKATAAHSHPYYSGWGGYHSYYGYGHHAPPPPPPPHGHPAQSPSHPCAHPGYGPVPYGQWGGPPPPPGYSAYPPPPPGHGHHYPPHAAPKSALETTAEVITSGAESIKNWTRQSLSFGGLHSTNSGDGQDSRSLASSKPISYVHQPDGKKRRMVKFQDNDYGKRGISRPSCASLHSNNSLMDPHPDDIEPHSLEASDAQNDTLMNQVANQILVSFGSWDTSAICGHDNADDRVPFPQSESKPGAAQPDEEMAVEWEGQEVQLTDKNNPDYNSEGSDERMPPPVGKRNRYMADQASSVGFSSLGSCHSWLPGQISSAASYFGGSRDADMDMDYSAGAGTEQFSTGGSLGDSLGGNSLTKVFENATLPDQMPSSMASPNMSHRNLCQIPSWERNLRSRSPLSIGSADDDESLVSKAESVLSKGSISSSLSGLRGAAASPTNMETEMAWESRE